MLPTLRSLIHVSRSKAKGLWAGEEQQAGGQSVISQSLVTPKA